MNRISTEPDYLIQYRGSTPKAAAKQRADPVKRLYTAVDVGNILLDGQANAGLRPAFSSDADSSVRSSSHSPLKKLTKTL